MKIDNNIPVKQLQLTDKDTLAVRPYHLDRNQVLLIIGNERFAVDAQRLISAIVQAQTELIR